jgi:hypothetical protein
MGLNCVLGSTECVETQGMWASRSPMEIDEAPFRQFYRASKLRPSHPADHRKGEWSCPARNDVVGGRQVHIQRSEQIVSTAI